MKITFVGFVKMNSWDALNPLNESVYKKKLVAVHLRTGNMHKENDLLMTLQ